MNKNTMNNTIVTDRKKQKLILFSIAFGSFMVNLDTYIVNISLPTIADYFHATPAGVSWVSLAYNLVVASLLMIFGKLGDKFGLKRVFIFGLALFTISSLMCGLAPTLYWLVIGRAIQGIGASILYSMTPAMVPKFMPENVRGTAFGTLATAAALGIMVGTPLGGIITGFVSWHWIFLINIPAGIMAIIACRRIMPDDHVSVQEGHKGGFDLNGAFLSFICSLSFIYGLNSGQENGWTSPLIILCFAISAVSLSLFIFWEKKAPFPLMDLSLFKNKAFTYGNIATLLAYIYLAGNNFLMPFYLQLVKGLKSEHAGMVFLIYSIVYMVVGPLAGKISDRINPRIVCTAGMALAAFSAFMFSFFLKLPGLIPVIIYFILLAISYATFLTSNNTVVVGMAPEGKQGIVSGIFRMVTRLGIAGGVCIFETIFTTASHVSGHGGKIDYASLPVDLVATGFHYTYLAGGFVCLLTVIMSLLAREEQKKVPKRRYTTTLLPEI
jgi:EmrB/QacA subfamily drug resistance transporter